MTSKQVDELIVDKENRDKKEYESSIEEKGYKRGVQDGKMQKEKEEGQINGEEPNSVDVPMDDFNGVEDQPSEEEIQMMGALENQQIPDEVLQELLMLSQNDPEIFKEIIVNYPQLAEMLQQDIETMNGGKTLE